MIWLIARVDKVKVQITLDIASEPVLLRRFCQELQALQTVVGSAWKIVWQEVACVNMVGNVDGC